MIEQESLGTRARVKRMPATRARDCTERCAVSTETDAEGFAADGRGS